MDKLVTSLKDLWWYPKTSNDSYELVTSQTKALWRNWWRHDVTWRLPEQWLNVQLLDVDDDPKKSLFYFPVKIVEKNVRSEKLVSWKQF